MHRASGRLVAVAMRWLAKVMDSDAVKDVQSATVACVLFTQSPFDATAKVNQLHLRR
jgi:hypothetical protein